MGSLGSSRGFPLPALKGSTGTQFSPLRCHLRHEAFFRPSQKSCALGVRFPFPYTLKGVTLLNEKIAAVQMRDITKRFGSVLANDRVWLDIYKGEIMALLGENGSGKTTLMNMLSGIYYPDEGHIYVNGKEVSIRSPKDAFD